MTTASYMQVATTIETEWLVELAPKHFKFDKNEVKLYAIDTILSVKKQLEILKEPVSGTISGSRRSC